MREDNFFAVLRISPCDVFLPLVYVIAFFEALSTNTLPLRSRILPRGTDSFTVMFSLSLICSL